MEHQNKTSLERFTKTLPTVKKPNGLEIALKSDQMSKVRRESPAIAEGYIALLLGEVNTLLKAELTTEDIAGYAEIICNEHWGMRIQEFSIVFSNGVNGRYGKIYGAPNYGIISEWFMEHEKDRNKHFEAIEIQEKADKTFGDSNRTSEITIKKAAMLSSEDLKELERGQKQ